MRADSFASRNKSAHMAVNNDPLLPKKRAGPSWAESVVAFCSWGPPSPSPPLWAVLTCQKSKSLYMRREIVLWLSFFLVQSQCRAERAQSSVQCSPEEGNWGETPSEHDGFKCSSWPWVELYAPTDTVLSDSENKHIWQAHYNTAGLMEGLHFICLIDLLPNLWLFS